MQRPEQHAFIVHGTVIARLRLYPAVTVIAAGKFDPVGSAIHQPLARHTDRRHFQIGHLRKIAEQAFADGTLSRIASLASPDTLIEIEAVAKAQK